MIRQVFLGGTEVDVETFKFPDNQPHVILKRKLFWPVDSARIICSITSSDDLMELLLVKQIIDSLGIRKVTLDISYLMGARMDRAIADYQPWTLKVITDILSNAFDHNCSINTFDIHSEVSTAVLNSVNVLPFRQVEVVLDNQTSNTVVIIPDLGATKRVELILAEIQKITGEQYEMVQCLKHRDMQTGQLSGFRVLDPEKVNGKVCVIVDDLCDGGGTFVGIAKKLRDAGAIKVVLYVSHGIFSKGWPLEGIDEIWTTDSYKRNDEILGLHVLHAW
ncbi:MAG: phosphoribosyltransferase family protein [Nitrosarchaeum sp.]|nr:phosphoribosyltransferase family protein [Nitrosarchaeum sp.]